MPVSKKLQKGEVSCMSSRLEKIRRFTAVMTVLFVIPFIFLTNRINHSDNTTSTQSGVVINIANAEINAVPLMKTAERLFSAREIKISRANTSRKTAQHRYLHCLLNGSAPTSDNEAALSICSLLQLILAVFARKYIIRYIHYQDGYKDNFLRSNVAQA